MLRANDYQKDAERTLVRHPSLPLDDEGKVLVWMTMGLTGETGEVCECLKKGIFHEHGLDKQHLKEELGDSLWYLSAIASAAGFTLEEVMQANMEKRMKRYPDGFSPEASRRRADVEPK